MFDSHAGSWSIFGTPLPDFGVTEKIGDLFGQSRNDQGGSQLRQGTVANIGNVPYVTNNVAPTSRSYSSTQLGGPNINATTNQQQQKQQQQQQNTSSNSGGGPGGWDWQSSLRSVASGGHNVGDVVGDWRWNGERWERTGGGDDSGIDINAQNQQVENAFNAGMDVLNQQESNLNAQAPAENQFVTDQYGNLVEKAKTEGEGLVADLNTKQSDFGSTVNNALQEATRAYNALKQQIMARFGFGSSAGQGASDIASQEYYRTMGQNQQEGIRGRGEFAKEFGKIKTYVSQKVSDLDLWKTDSLNKLKADLADKLNQISIAKSTLIGNKSYATMQVMQNAVANAQAIAQQDKQFRQQIASDALNNMQQVAGRAFTPQEIKATLASFGINVPGGQVAATNPTNMYRITGKKEDDMSKLYGS